mgnify:CR=1 FL=1
MKWRGQRESSNVEIGGGTGRGGGLKLGLGGIVIVMVLGLVMGKNPMEMLGIVAQMEQQAPASQSTPVDPNAPLTEAQQFSTVVLASTEDVWSKIFADNNARYPAPTINLFQGSVQSACGGATSASGPFYCPGDQKVYLDTQFFDEMKTSLGGGGDFAQAYVIAHEVGHHVQHLLGIADQVTAAQQRAGEAQANALSVRMELQADCLAGVWGNHANRTRRLLEPGDVEEGLKAAAAIGDDMMQRQSAGRVRPESWTPCSSEMRVRWLRQGLSTGDADQCDTFQAERL